MKKTEFFKKHLLYLAAFSLPVIIMMIIFIIRSIYPFGEQSFLHVDMYHQYFPFLTEFFHKLKSGDSLLYSFHAGLGSNFIDLFSYYLATPFNWLSVFVPEAYLLEFMTYLVIIKIGLSSVTLTYYFRHRFQTKSYSILFFAIAYALSGYVAAYNWDVMWLDCIILAPLILLGLERLVSEGKCRLYCITLTLSILTNYYLSILICIFLVFYFLVLFVNTPNKKKAFLRFAGYSLLAGGMASVLLIPAFEMLRQSEYSQSTFPGTLKSFFPLFDVFARHLANVSVETGLDNWPNLFCGVAVLFLFPLYWGCQQIPLREKLAKCCLLLFLIISFSNNVLTFIWHGFNYPSSLPSRQSFLYILLLLTICYEAYLHREEFVDSIWLKLSAGVGLFLILCEKLVTDDAITIETYLLSGVLLFIYGLLFYLSKRKKVSANFLFGITLLVVMLEFGFNMFLTSVPTVSRTNYMEHYDTYRDMIADNEEIDPSLFRIEKESSKTQNDATLNGFRSPSMFSSTTNSYINSFYEKYGMRSSRVFYSSQGMTPFMSAFLDIKYTLTEEEKEETSMYRLLEERDGVYLYENQYALPIGFLIHDTVPVTETFPSNPIEEQNLLAEKLGSSEPIFEYAEVMEEGFDALIRVESDSYIYAFINESSVKEATAYVDGEEMTFDKLKNPYILDFGWQPAGTEIRITSEEDAPLRLAAYTLNEEALTTLLDTLKEQPFTVSSHSSTRIEGSITALSDGDLFLSIPYEPNWKVLIDGVPSKVQPFEKSFLEIPITAGEHTITLTYHCPALVIGAIISIICLLLFVFLCLRKKKEMPVES